jgi:uncharacterized metal-binding protein
VSREEFALYDVFKSMSFIQFIISCLVLCMGVKGIRLSLRQKTPLARKIFKKTRCTLLIITFLGLILGHFHHEKMKIIEDIVDPNHKNHHMKPRDQPVIE